MRVSLRLVRCLALCLGLGWLGVGCGPSDAREAIEKKDVDWLSAHATAGEADAMAGLCSVANEGDPAAAAALLAAWAGKDPNAHLATISCMIDVGLKGNGALLAVGRALVGHTTVAVRTAALNALDAAAADPNRRASVVALIPDLVLRLSDEEVAVWRRALNILHNIGPQGRAAIAAGLRVPSPTRRQELARRIADLDPLALELGPPALEWILQGESEVFGKLTNIIVRSGTPIEVAKPTLLALLGSGDDGKIESGVFLAGALASEGRCDAEVVRAVLSATPRAACEEPCLGQARTVAYKCRVLGEAVLRELAAEPASEELSGRPGEIARATLGS